MLLGDDLDSMTPHRAYQVVDSVYSTVYIYIYKYTYSFIEDLDGFPHRCFAQMVLAVRKNSKSGDHGHSVDGDQSTVL